MKPPDEKTPRSGETAAFKRRNELLPIVNTEAKPIPAIRFDVNCSVDELKARLRAILEFQGDSDDVADETTWKLMDIWLDAYLAHSPADFIGTQMDLILQLKQCANNRERFRILFERIADTIAQLEEEVGS
jgi:hypothetical protein